MNELTKKFREEFKDKETRRIYVDDFLNASIATQIKVLREQRGLTQAQLAELAEMRQERISVLEDVDYSSWTINVLRRIAEALDLRLSVKFESFGSFLHEFETFGRKSLERASFDDDPTFQPSPTTSTALAFLDTNATFSYQTLEDAINKAVKAIVPQVISDMTNNQTPFAGYQKTAEITATEQSNKSVVPEIAYLNQTVA